MAKKSRLSEETFKFAEDMAAPEATSPAPKAATPDAGKAASSSGTGRTPKKKTAGTKKPAVAKKSTAAKKSATAKQSATATGKTTTPKKPATAKKTTASKKTTTAKKTTVVKKTTAAKQPASAAGVSGRTLYVKYRADGTIVSIVEVMSGREVSGWHPFGRVKEDEQVDLIALPKGLATKRLAELHRGCRVKTSGTKPSLVLKK